MKIVSIVGARPQFVKLAPVHHELAKVSTHLIIHTGQHYDPSMSASFFENLRIPAPAVNLEVGSSTHAQQTGRIMATLEPELLKIRPDWVVVYGDTNSTLAAAITAVKLDLRVAHLEAGLRSFNRLMPEEHNRVLSDHTADLCLAPTATAMKNLAHEGLSDRSVLVGDVMVDVLYQTMAVLGISPTRSEREIAGSYLATIHRQENTDDAGRLAAILEALNSLDKTVNLLAHPRLTAKMVKFGIPGSDFKRVSFVRPLPYPELVRSLSSSPGLITDSGGLQKEAFLLQVPCVTLRTETEWLETIELGWNYLSEPNPKLIREHLTTSSGRVVGQTPYGDGYSASRVAETLLREL